MRVPASPTPDYFTLNRQKVMDALQGGLLVMAGYTAMQRSNDEEMNFTQEATFWWLSGVEFADWWLIIDASRGKSWLVEPEIDERHRLFTQSLSIDTAVRTSGVDAVLSRDKATTMLRAAARSHKLVYTVGQSPYAEYFDFTLNPAASQLHKILSRTFASVNDFRHDIAKLRAIKQDIEIKWLQAAIDLTVDTLAKVRTDMASYNYEYEIEAELSYAYRKTGASGHGFDPIVASKQNATTAHYFSNNSRISKSSFVMIDTGARVNGFSADLTRTYVKGTPTARMREVYEAVQAAQAEIIDLISPGLAVEDYQKQSDEIIKKRLYALKLISSLEDADGYRRFMPHSVSHGLGIDIHESLGKPKYFEPGMVITVEPGIYIPEESIGVRIEDDILVTHKSHKNMSAKLSTTL